MKIHPATIIQNELEGKPAQLNGNDLTIGKAIATALMHNTSGSKDPATILDSFQLAMDLNKEPAEMDITNVQEETIKKALPHFFTPLIVGPVLQHLKSAAAKEEKTTAKKK